jgi:hypothetical protein
MVRTIDVSSRNAVAGQAQSPENAATGRLGAASRKIKIMKKNQIISLDRDRLFWGNISLANPAWSEIEAVLPRPWRPESLADSVPRA